MGVVELPFGVVRTLGGIAGGRSVIAPSGAGSSSYATWLARGRATLDRRWPERGSK
jgi:hypothetical protein